ncbi:MAG: hypothetical protein ACRDOD_11375 [Streptosporangiaceae bacterium]
MPARSADDVRIETYSGPRANLRRLFELAEDSVAELDSCIDAPSPPPPATRPACSSTASS